MADIAVEAPDSKERVAWEMAKAIGHDETLPANQKKTREYWLLLYYECFRVVRGIDPRQK